MARAPAAQALQLDSKWAGFDLVKVGGQAPAMYARDGFVVVSGCVTTTCPSKQQSGWRSSIGALDPRCAPKQSVPFLAPTSMSRYEGIYQCGTSAGVDEDGSIKIFFTKNTQPMVLHLSGLCFPYMSKEDPITFPLAQVSKTDWGVGVGGKNPAHSGLKLDESRPLALQRCGNIVFLQGQLQEATFGPTSQLLAQLPEAYRPRRELRCLAALMAAPMEAGDGFEVYYQTMAVTVHTDGKISAQGGKVHQVDNKGQMRVYQQNKRGMLNLQGVRFSLVEGEPIVLVAHLQTPVERTEEATTSKMGYLLGNNANAASNAPTAVVVRQGDVCMLEGFLSWSTTKMRPPHAKRPLAILPSGCWPKRRECFFTRGGSDLEERRRVDIDAWGRIFCPEGVTDGRVELTGIIFVAAEKPPSTRLRDPDDWDDLKLQYQRSEVGVSSTSFDGHELLEAFVKRSNFWEWDFVQWDFQRHASRKMLMPLGPSVPLRGHRSEDQQNLKNDRSRRFWNQYKAQLQSLYGMTTFYTLLQVSDAMFEQVVREAKIDHDSARFVEDLRSKQKIAWAETRAPGLDVQKLNQLAKDIVDQMFEHWDFKAQLQGALENDFRPPATIEHMFPKAAKGRNGDWLIKKNIEEKDMPKFEEIRQFFYLYETTGSNMTHCSLMGASDTFSSTGKWHFPDSPEVQKQLFENIEWLFPKKMYLYMSERQTQRFPFIEDFDVQARMDYTDPEMPTDGSRPPPDHLIMNKPIRTGPNPDDVTGDPGELMKWRALAIHMVYPHIDELDALVYSASGVNKGKEMLKSSFHLVWPQLIVDPDRAPVLRHVTLGIFRKQTMLKGSYLEDRQKRLLNLHESNSWELVFDSTTINARNGLRLPYNDKASMVIKDPADKQRVKDGTLSKTKAPKSRVCEHRPSIAVGMIRFTFIKDPETGDIKVGARWVADAKTYRISEWIAKGTCRRDPNCTNQAELTPWQLGPEVLQLLPMKPGQQWDIAEGEDDGEGGHWVTHKPFPQIRRYNHSVKEFVSMFEEALADEQDALRQEENFDFRKRVAGMWIHVTENQAIWRAAASSQLEAKVPDTHWHKRSTDRWRTNSSGARPPDCCIVRPAEVIYLQSKGKVIVDGPQDVVEALLRPLKAITKPDDNAVMPIYDVEKMLN